MNITLAFNADNQERAERLLDGFYWIGGKFKLPHILLIAVGQMHDERKIKTRIAAEIAFNSVDLIDHLPAEGGKFKQENMTFRLAARYAKDCYRDPWIWLNPFCVPLQLHWYGTLFEAYTNQPRRYMGRHLMGKQGRFLSRTAIYPINAVDDLEPYFDNEAPFERLANILPRTTSSTLFNVQDFVSGEIPNAALLDGNADGSVLEKLIEKTGDKITSKMEPLVLQGK